MSEFDNNIATIETILNHPKSIALFKDALVDFLMYGVVDMYKYGERIKQEWNQDE